MNTFPFDKLTVKLYRYYFHNCKQPIIILAYDQLEARTILQKQMPSLPAEYQQSRVVGQTVTVPLFGISELETPQGTNVWVGKKHSPTGWMKKSEFQTKFGKKK